MRLISELTSTLEADMVRRRKTLGGIITRKETVIVMLKSNFLVVESRAKSGRKSSGRSSSGSSTVGGSQKKIIPGTHEVALVHSLEELSEDARIINLDGAVVEDASGTSAGAHSLQVAYVDDRGAVKRVVLAAADAEEHTQWLEAISRVAGRTAVTRADFEPFLLLGKGHFGRVSLVKHKETGAVLALKEMHEERVVLRNEKRKGRGKGKGKGRGKARAKPTLSELKLQKQISERLLLASLVKNDFVARLAFAFRERGRLFFASEFAARGDLWTLIRAKKRLDVASTRFLASEVVAALASLHEHGILHRDIKLENVMLTEAGHVKVIDFGLSKQLSQRPSTVGKKEKRFGFTYSMAGTSYYLSPEMVHGVGHNLSADWWQLGCLVYELLVGKPAFFAKATKEVHEKITSGAGADLALLRQHAGEGALADAAVDFVQRLLTRDAGDRLGASGADAVMEHSFFKGVDWDDVNLRDNAVPAVIDAYVGDAGSVVDKDTVATYFRDAKTLSNHNLNESSSGIGKPGSAVGLRRRAANGSSASAASVGSALSTNTVGSRRPTLPKRSESGGPLLGFNFAVSSRDLDDIAGDLVIV